MKNKLFILVGILFLFTNCSKDDSSVSETSLNLIGKWEVHTVIDYDENNNVVEKDFYQPGERVWEFKENGYVHINEEGGMNRDVEYQYKPKDNDLVVMGILLKIKSLTSEELIVLDGQHEMQYRKL